MSVFPRLRTGAIAQYPAVREFHFATEVRRYIDNSEQRYRDVPALRKRWTIDLSRLDEGEAAQLTEFFTEQQGSYGAFDFEDPWSGAVVSNCRFEQDLISVHIEAEWDSSTQLTIIEPAS
jgi:hypothetical protein